MLERWMMNEYEQVLTIGKQYVDTQQSEVTMTVNGVAPGGEGLVPAERYVVHTLVRSGLIQHGESQTQSDSGRKGLKPPQCLQDMSLTNADFLPS